MSYLKLGIIAIIPIIIGVLGQVFFKLGMLKIGEFAILQKGIFLQYFKIFTNPYIFIGLMCYGISTAFYLFFISRVPLSLAYPTISIGYIIVALISWYFFKEQLSFVNWLGLMMIVSGVIFLAWGRA